MYSEPVTTCLDVRTKVPGSTTLLSLSTCLQSKYGPLGRWKASISGFVNCFATPERKTLT